MPRAFELASAQPWLMLPDALDNLLSIADRQNDLEALETRLGRQLDHTHTVTQRGNVAVIPVTGARSADATGRGRSAAPPRPSLRTRRLRVEPKCCHWYRYRRRAPYRPGQSR